MERKGMERQVKEMSSLAMPFHSIPFLSLQCHAMPFHGIPCLVFPLQVIPFHAFS
jgi:hypothetical protein